MDDKHRATEARARTGRVAKVSAPDFSLTDHHSVFSRIAQGSKQVFAANQWGPNLWSAKLDSDDTWSEISAPATQIAEGSDGGIPFLAFDDAHGILYASMFSGGVARMVVK